MSIPFAESKQIPNGTLSSTQIEFEFVRGMYKFTHSQLEWFSFNIFEAN